MELTEARVDCDSAHCGRNRDKNPPGALRSYFYSIPLMHPQEEHLIFPFHIQMISLTECKEFYKLHKAWDLIPKLDILLKSLTKEFAFQRNKRRDSSQDEGTFTTRSSTLPSQEIKVSKLLVVKE